MSIVSHRRPRGQMSEAFLTAAFLSLSGGLQDAYTYIARGEVFANAQTGNIVLLSQNLFAGAWGRALHYLVPLTFFALGIAAAELVRFQYQKATRIHWRQLVLLAEIVLLFAVGLMPGWLDLLANAVVSFSCAMQVQAFRKVNGYAFASTMCIGNLRSGMDSLCSWLVAGNRAAKDVVVSAHRYGIDAMGAMAQGLFASLLIGTIIKTLGQQLGLAFLVTAGTYAAAVAGPAMAASIGYALHAPQLVLFSLIAVGGAANELGGAGGPLAVYLIAIVAAEVGKLVSKETKVDILVTPAVTILVGTGLSVLFAPAIGKAASAVGSVIMWATELQPLLMGIVVSVLVGVALTLPISSAAICAALGLTGLAGGAAVAGCCAQMVGFAVMSYRENGVGGLVSQGLGTSMLQMPNIIRNPRIWIPPTLAAAITGPIATCLFRLEMNGPAVSSGMGTCGLVGQIGVYTGWVETGKAVTAFDWLGLVLICFVLPAVLSVIFCDFMRKKGYIKDGDLKLD